MDADIDSETAKLVSEWSLFVFSRVFSTTPKPASEAIYQYKQTVLTVFIASLILQSIYAAGRARTVHLLSATKIIASTIFSDEFSQLCKVLFLSKLEH